MADEKVWGEDLTKYEGFLDAVKANIKAINEGMRGELKKKKSTADILAKLDEAGQNLVDARKRRKKAQNILNNKNSSEKQLRAARKTLKTVNSEIEKYQRQVEKYKTQLEKVGASVAQTVTQRSIGELTNTANEFRKIFNKMGDKTGNILYKIPSVLSAYMQNVKSSASYAKGIVNSVEKIFGSNIKSMDSATNEQINALEKKLNKAEKKRKEANKVLNSDKSTEKERKKAEKELKKAEKTIANLNTKIAKERETLGGAGVVDKFAERLYYNSEAYKEEVKQVKASTKKIQKIQKAAEKASFDIEDLPDVDLLIRTGGELRLSNFLLWHAAYSELLFSNTLWPDYNEIEFEKNIKEFQLRVRRFGGV